MRAWRTRRSANLGILQIVAQIDVGKLGVAVFIVHPGELGSLALAAILQGAEEHAVEIAGHQLQEHGGRVRLYLKDIAVKIDPALEVVGIVSEDDPLPTLPVQEFIRPGADGVAGQRGFGEILALQQVPGDDAHPPAIQGRGEGLGVGDPEGVVVRGLGLFHLEVVAGVGGGGLGIHHHLVGEEDILGGERGAVVPLDAVAQMEGDGEAVRGDFPGLGQGAHQVEVAVVLHQAVVNQAVDVAGGAVGGQGRQEGAGVTDGAVDEPIAISGAGVGAAVLLLLFGGLAARGR